MSHQQQQPAFDAFAFDAAKLMAANNLDFFSYNGPADGILAPHPDLFESEVDFNLAGLDDSQIPVQLLVDHSADSFQYIRQNNTHSYGPPSSITVSSESEYNSYRSELDSFYSYPTDDAASSVYSPNPNPITTGRVSLGYQPVSNGGHPFPSVLDHEYGGMENLRARMYAQDPNDYRNMVAQQPTATGLATADDLQQYGHLMPSHQQPADGGAMDLSSDYFSNTLSGMGAVNPNNTMSSGVGPSHPSLMSVQVRQPEDESRRDPRKKYQCPNCPRAFARAYNLKTHMATHDPNRLKPHVCPHRSCGRSFSRRHDLGRHLVSIHRDEVPSTADMGKVGMGAIGVSRNGRTWCDGCGLSTDIGSAHECSAEEVR